MNTVPERVQTVDENAEGQPVTRNRDRLARFRRVTSFLLLMAGIFGLVTAGILTGQYPGIPVRELSYLLLVISLLGTGALLARTESSYTPNSKTLLSRLDFPFFVAAIAVLVGAAFRFYGLDFDFPYFYHPDEARKVRVIQRMMEGGTLDPNYFLHPTLLLYSTYATSELFRLLGIEFQTESIRIAYAGRFVSATLGTATIFLVFAIASRLYNRRTAAIAALLIALMPLHITCSRYFKEDVIFSTFGLVCLLFVIAAAQDRKAWKMLLAGLFAGISMGSKYTGILSIAFLCIYPFLRERKYFPNWRSFLPVGYALLVMPIGFLICTPYAIFNFAKFQKDFMAEGKHISRGHGGISITASSQLWMYHLSRSIMKGATWLPTALSILAVGMLLVRRRFEDLIVVACILLFYLPAEYIKAKPMPQPDRYILPVLAFAMIGAAEFLRVQFRRAWLWPVVAIVALVPAYQSYRLASELYDDTRLQMARWVNENIPRGSDIVLVGEVKYLPRLSPRRYRLKAVGTNAIRDRLTIDRLRASPHQYILSTSLSSDRYVLQPNADPVMRQRFLEYERDFEVVKVLGSEAGSYGFHNPTFTLYRVTRPQPVEN